MIKTIFLKELKDTLRDRRTLIMMILIPVLVFPVIMNIFMKVSSSFEKDAAEKILKIGFVGDANTLAIDNLINLPKSLGKHELIPYATKSELVKDVKKDSIQIGFFVPVNAIALENQQKPALLEIHCDASDIGVYERAENYVEYIEGAAKRKRLAELKIDESKLQPIVSSYQNVASDIEMIGKLAGGFLPYIFIAFGFIGCMYPAIDLFTGEKERGTVETLLTTPVPRWKILLGKMGVVVASGLMASIFALIGLYLSIEVMNVEIDPKLMEIVKSILSVGFMLSLFLLLLPLIIFFAGVMIPIAVYAKSFKEAQSIITPLNFIMILPAMIGFFPGIELNLMTACIPVVNVVLATKEMIAGTLHPGLMALSFGIMLLLAIASIVVSYKQFGKESNVTS